MTPTSKAEGVRERAWELFIKVLDIEPEQAKYFEEEIGAIEVALEAEALLARKEEREACSRAVCQNCANALPVKNSSQWIWIHEVPGIGIGPCHAAAIHSRNQEEGR